MMNSKRTFQIEIFLIIIILLLPFLYNFLIVKPKIDRFRSVVAGYVFYQQINLSDKVKIIGNGGRWIWITNLEGKDANEATIEIKSWPIVNFSSGSGIEQDPLGGTSIFFSPSAWEHPLKETYDEKMFHEAALKVIKDKRILEAISKPDSGRNFPENQQDGLSYIEHSTIEPINYFSWEFENEKLFKYLNFNPPKVKTHLFGLYFSLEDYKRALPYFLFFDANNFSPVSSYLFIEVILLLIFAFVSYLLAVRIFSKSASFLKLNLIFLPVFSLLLLFNMFPLIAFSLLIGDF